MSTLTTRHIPYQDRCIGCLLGTVCGDILGAPVEGWPASEIARRFGRLRDFQEIHPNGARYTDDTQMTLALALSLVECRRVDAERVSYKYAELYEPSRGYSSVTHRIMQALGTEADYRSTGRLHFPEGSFGNGGAMRIAPVGLAYRNAPDQVLHQAVQNAVVCTHVHPEGIDGAFIHARAVAEMSKTPDLSAFDRLRFVGSLIELSRTETVREKLSYLAGQLNQGKTADDEVISNVGNGLRASEAVAAALWAFLTSWDVPEECVIRAVGFGGDTDTMGALSGSLAGALHGTAWIPARWYEHIENRKNGRDKLIAVARELAALDLRL